MLTRIQQSVSVGDPDDDACQNEASLGEHRVSLLNMPPPDRVWLAPRYITNVIGIVFGKRRRAGRVLTFVIVKKERQPHESGLATY